MIDFRSDIDTDQGLLILEVWDIQGAMHHTEKLTMQAGAVTTGIDTRFLPSGTYLIRLSGTYLIRLKCSQFVLTKSAVITR